MEWWATAAAAAFWPSPEPRAGHLGFVVLRCSFIPEVTSLEHRTLQWKNG